MDELVASVRAEQRDRWGLGDRVRMEELLNQHPDLRENPEVTLDLVYAEVLLAEEFGEAVDPDAYLARFPAHAPALARQLEFHALWASAESGRERDSWDGPDAGLPAVPGYRLLRELGRGSWAVVYEAEQLSLGRRVAVKVLHAGVTLGGAPAGLRREAELAARLRHPQVVEVYDYGEADGRAYAVLELVGGGTLAEWAGRRPFSPVGAAGVLELVARAVHHAHQCGVVHRDLKPANILMAKAGDPRVTDFGLARRLDGASTLAPAGGLVGTLAYMAPEQAAGKPGQVGPAADIYALGVILKELVTGAPAAGPLTPEGRAPAGSGVRQLVPPPLDAVCQKCLEPAPARRYPTALALAEDLARYRAGQPVRAGQVLERASRAARRHRRGVTVGVVTVVCAVGVLSWGPRPAPGPPLSAEAIGAALTRGEPVTLIPASGPPAWVRWRLPGGTARAEGRTYTVESWGLGLLELAPDPGTGRFRLSAEVRHEESDENGAAGVYVGHEAVGPPGADSTHVFVRLAFNDIRQGTPVSLRRHVHTAGNRGGLWDLQLSGVVRDFGPPAGRGLAGWRRVAVEVDEANLTGVWGDGQRVGPVPVPTLERATEAELSAARRRSPGHPYASRVNPRFLPRGGLGVYVRRGVAAIRNVRLEPLGPTN
ncbi:MAG: serine/threonine-protein kinase [Gemmataceae bacterium]